MKDVKKNIFVTAYDPNENKVEVFNNIEEKYKNILIIDVI